MRHSLMFIFLMLLVFSGLAFADERGTKTHKYWQSSNVGLPGISTMADHSGEKSILTLTVPPPQCKLNPFFIYVGTNGKEIGEIPMTVSVKIDNGTVYQATGTFMDADEGLAILIIKLDKDDEDKAIKEAFAGNLITFRMHEQHEIYRGQPIYRSYSLAGFTAASKRAISLCQQSQ